MEINGLDPYDKTEAPRKSAKRGAYLLPGAFTVANLLCGYYAILATLDGSNADFENASRAIGFAILFDALDGRIARALGANSEFGKQFDSLADVVSFGVAPAFLAYAWGVRNLPISEVGQAVHIYQLGWLVSFIFVVCCAWRLARFNIHGMSPGGSGYFVGMPTPAAAGMIAATVHCITVPIQTVKMSLLWLLLMLALAALMSSTVRHFSGKNIRWDRRQSSRMLVPIAVVVAAVLFYSGPTLLAIASAYAAHGVILEVARMVRHRIVSRPA